MLTNTKSPGGDVLHDAEKYYVKLRGVAAARYHRPSSTGSVIGWT
jgi:hypothetical protein